jgi:hypothetical protein
MRVYPEVETNFVSKSVTTAHPAYRRQLRVARTLPLGIGEL